ncbi:hypothetical protein [Francisella tularensis]|uniref:hypothetical protein n=1 Tax=Francisella tularensis TaxID=263 RepID=UPI000A7E24A2
MCTEPSFWLGNHAFAHEKQLCNNSLLHKKATQLADSGLTLIFVGNSKDIIGIIAIQDKSKYKYLSKTTKKWDYANNHAYR